MLRFGSALAFGLQHFGNRNQANAPFQSLIKYEPGQRLSSPNGLSVMRKISSGEDEAIDDLERQSFRSSRSLFLWCSRATP